MTTITTAIAPTLTVIDGHPTTTSKSLCYNTPVSKEMMLNTPDSSGLTAPTVAVFLRPNTLEFLGDALVRKASGMTTIMCSTSPTRLEQRFQNFSRSIA